MNNIKKKIKTLQKVLIYHNYLYFCLEKPIISDYEYDLLFNKLKFLEKKYQKEINLNSPTQLIGSKVFSSSTNKHLTPMLSLENIFKKNEFLNFYEKILKYKKKNELIKFICELKFDGIAVNLIYKNGVLKKASTRGDGEKGEDITRNIIFIKSIPNKILRKNVPKLMEIRGEVLMFKKDFLLLNKNNFFLNKNCFSSARNLVSGSLRQKNLQELKNRKLIFICHGFELFNFFFNKSYYHTLLKIKKWGFHISTRILLSSSIKKIFNFYLKIKYERLLLNFDIDGIVIKVNDLNLRKKIGFRSRSPRWAIAYKFPSKEKKTVLKNITFHVGRTGIITPVAHFSPVNISGVKIEKASIYNKYFLKKLNLKIGDEIFVCRAGDVIPKIIRKKFINVQDKKCVSVQFPKKCPSCQSTLKSSKNNKRNYCSNYFFCSEQIKKRLIHFFSKTSFAIKDLGPNIINQLVDKNNFKNPIDFFQLNINILNNLKNVGKKISYSIIESFKNFKLIELDKFIFSFGIPGIGKIASEKIAQNYKSLNNILNIKKNDLIKIFGIGPVIEKNFISFIQNKKNKHMIYKLIKNNIRIVFYRKKFQKNKKKSFFINKNFLITGILKMFSRKKIYRVLEDLGANIKKSISKKLDIVIRGKKPGKKLLYAEKLGIKIINEKKLLKKISE